jgi:uncharacterized membrane protein YozB (DUF420 family)
MKMFLAMVINILDIEIMVHGWKNKTKHNKRTIGITFTLWVIKCFKNHG